MTVVVTGASGHIGGVLVRALLAEGRSVRALIHEGDGLLGGLDIERVHGDVRDPESLAAAFAGADVIYHLAAIISIEGELGGLVPADNVEGARNVARAALASGARRLIHFSSIHAFDQAPLDAVLDETRPRATAAHHNAYDRSKAAGEAAVREVIAEGLDCVFVHPSGVIGPYDAAPSRMGQVFLDLHDRALPGLIDGGFNWVDVRDVVAGALAAEARGRAGENYLLSGHWRSVRDIAEMASAVTGVPRPRFISPMWLARMTAPFQMAWDRLRGNPLLFTSESLEALRANRTISNQKAVTELGFSARPTEDSVRDIYAWFRESGRLPAPGEAP